MDSIQSTMVVGAGAMMRLAAASGADGPITALLYEAILAIEDSYKAE